ncbi:fungal protein [Schizosaccharomyces japonicus yFS275]|uniref:Fungal protein n=1 Tax=Schizosaccharomyces japonicus (strain yFS275 / FY16936) TaxID=402676 RepID=B6JXC3_SCHJY|nr:fungal protein [Schizosaccharomyces japonicus yFS275]EEB06024.1 fungal protein [Schizosaccharomyces japonicus yFS275]
MARIIRKTSLRSRIVNAPIDWVMHLAENIDSIEWEKLSEKWTIPCAIACNLVFILMRIFVRNMSFRQQRSSLFVSQKPSRGSWFQPVASCICFLLVLISIINAGYCLFYQKKKYTMTQPNAMSAPSTPNVYPVSNPVSPEGESMLQLVTWNPSSFHLQFACLFSPIHVLCLWIYSTSFLVLLLTFGFSLQLYYLGRKFQLLIKDQHYLHRQVFYEYDKKFVEPRLSVRKRDVAVSTRSGPGSATIEYYSPRKPIDSFLEHRSAPMSPITPSTSSAFRRSARARHSLATPIRADSSSIPFKRFPRLSEGPREL